MAYVLGSIVWYRKLPDDPEINYPGNDPCAATVVAVHSPTSADLKIMMDNDTPVIRGNVPLIFAGDVPPAGAYATASRD